MPGPSSRTVISIRSPIFRAWTSMTPPSGIARRAFVKRLMNTRSQAQLRRSSIPGSSRQTKRIGAAPEAESESSRS
jgi:hypothetical protein